MSEPELGGAHRRGRTRRVRSRRGWSRRRWLVISGLAAVLVLLGLAGWLYHQASAARDELSVVRDKVHQLRTEITAGDLTAARATAAEIAQHAHRARDDTSGPLWAVAANLPFAGQPLDDERTIAHAVDGIATKALPSLIDASKILDPKTLRRADGSIDLAPLMNVSAGLTGAANEMRNALAEISRLPSSSWLAAADRARSDAISQLTPLTSTIAAADVAAATTPSLLGEFGPKSYIVTFENESELRGGGGLPGAFAILKANKGKLSFTNFEPDSTLVHVPSGLNLGPVFARTFSTPDATKDYRAAHVSPNFPYAAQIWIAEWRVKTGQQLDGAMALDPTALSYLLNITGPATMPDGSLISGSDVVQRTERDVYALFTEGQTAQRKQYLLDVARSVSTKLISPSGDLTALVRAAGRAASERRLMIWSKDPKIEARLAQTSISSAVPRSSEPFAAVAINNEGANKLDYYLHASLSWVGHGCGPQRTATVTITLKNDAPTDVPKNALGFTGRPGLPQSPGDNLLQVVFYGTTGGGFSSVKIDGLATAAIPGEDLTHPTYTVQFLIPRGATKTITLNLNEPGRQAPKLWLQPMVNPMTGTVTDGCP